MPMSTAQCALSCVCVLSAVFCRFVSVTSEASVCAYAHPGQQRVCFACICAVAHAGLGDTQHHTHMCINACTHVQG